QPEAGVVFADRALRAFLRGVRVEQRRVASLDDVEEPVVVVTAGAWARGLLAGAGVDLPGRAAREAGAYFRLHGSLPLPSGAKLRPGSHSHAVYGLWDPLHGLKLGCHHCGPEADPDTTGEPDPLVVAEMSAWAAASFDGVGPEPVAAETCFYTTTAD